MSSATPPSSGPPGWLPPRPPNGVPAAAAAAPPAPQQEPEWERRVPLWSPFAVALAAFVLASIAYAVIAGVAGLSADEADDAPGPVLGATFVQDALLVGGAVLAIGLGVRHGAAAALGLRGTRFWPAIGWSACVLGAFWLTSGILVALFGDPPEQEITEEIKSEDAAIALAGYIAITCLVAPIAEEVFFRGFLFPMLRARAGVVWGIVITGALFSVVHALGSPVEALIVLFVLGAGLCLLYLRTGSLLPCIGLHAFNNAISFAATKEMEWPVAILTVVGSVIVTVAIGLAFARSRADVAAT